MLLCLIEYLLGFDLNLTKFSNLECRVFISFIMSLFLVFFITPKFIVLLHHFNIVQVIRNDGPQSHLIKRDMPTMGGVILIVAIVFSILFSVCLRNTYVWYIIFILLSYGIIGLFDDYLKLIKRNSCGISMFWKYFWQSIFAVLVVIIMYIIDNNIIYTKLIVPFIKESLPSLNMWYLLLMYFVVVGSSNAINLTDGLDGLVIMPIIFISLGMALVSWLISDVDFASVLHISYISEVKELIVVCSSILGASIGFLWFNTYPSQIFMGDTGSLSLGGVIGMISVILQQPFLLLIMSGIFVIETLSVVLQIFIFKLYGRRIFYMAPIHHHFELKGIPEHRIVVRFWIISLISVLLGLIGLKLR